MSHDHAPLDMWVSESTNLLWEPVVVHNHFIVYCQSAISGNHRIQTGGIYDTVSYQATKQCLRFCHMDMITHKSMFYCMDMMPCSESNSHKAFSKNDGNTVCTSFSINDWLFSQQHPCSRLYLVCKYYISQQNMRCLYKVSDGKKHVWIFVLYLYECLCVECTSIGRMCVHTRMCF